MCAKNIFSLIIFNRRHKFIMLFIDNLDEDEKAFERLNNSRIYSSRIIEAEISKQQVKLHLEFKSNIMNSFNENKKLNRTVEKSYL